MRIGSKGAALLGSGAALVVAMAAMPGLAADSLDKRRAEMQQEILRLEQRLSALEAKRSRESRERRSIAAAAAVEAGSRRRTWKLPGTNTSMQIGGYAMLEIIYNINHGVGTDAVSSDGNSSGSFPSRGSAAANQQQHIRLHSRRTRLFIRTWTPTDYGTLQTRIEGDFFGGGGNEVVSNSDTLRIRHAYGVLGPVLAGQTYPLIRFTDFEMWSFQDRGLAGNGNGRQGQLRYSHKFGGGTALQVSIENPETSEAIASATYGQPVVVSGGGAPDNYPEIHVALLHVWSNGQVKVGGVFGQASIDDGVASNDKAFIWAAQAAFKLRFNNKRTEFAILGFFGEGMGKYWRGMPASLAVTGTNVQNVSAKPIRHFGGYAWISHKWTDTISTNIGFGRHDADVESLITKANIPARTLDVHWSFLANIIWRPIRSVRMGFEYHMLRSNFHNANESVIHRVEFAIRYDF